MRSTFALTTLATAIVVAGAPVTFSATGEGISGNLNTVRGGAGFSSVFIASGEGAEFDLVDGVVDGLGVTTNHLFEYGDAITSSTLEFEDDKITNYEFFACTGLVESLTDNSVVAANDAGNTTAPFDGCVPVTISRHTVVASSSSSSASWEASSSHHWNTTTEGYTVTDYVTYCPASTTITITSCKEHKCHPAEVTVSSPGTITITGEIIVPVVTADVTTAPKVVETSKAEETSTVAEVSFVAGAAKNAAGVLAGAAGLVALMI